MQKSEMTNCSCLMNEKLKHIKRVTMIYTKSMKNDKKNTNENAFRFHRVHNKRMVDKRREIHWMHAKMVIKTIV